MTDRAKVRVTIEYETDLGDPDAYEGESTPEGKAAKEAQYVREDAGYLIEAMFAGPHSMDVQVQVIETADGPVCRCGYPKWKGYTHRLDAPCIKH